MKGKILFSVIAMTASVSLQTKASVSIYDGSQSPRIDFSKERFMESCVKLDPSFVADPSKAARKTPSRLAPITEEPLKTVPEGERELMTRSTFGYIFYWGNLFYTLDEGSVVEKVEAADNAVYFSNPMSQLGLDSWIKGNVDPETGDVVIPGGQAVETQTNNGVEMTFYAVPLEYVITNPEEEMGWYYPLAEGEMRLKNRDGVLVSEDPEIMLGLCAYIDGEFIFQGYGDSDWKMAVQTDSPATLPAGVEAESWSYIVDQDGYFVNVAFNGNDVYLSGLFKTSRDSYVKGTLENGVITFKNGQYLGIDETLHYVYLYSGVLEEVWNEMFGEYTNALKYGETLPFDYNADTKRMKAQLCAAVSNVKEVSTEYAPYLDYLDNPEFILQERIVTALPANPCAIEIREFNDDFGYGHIGFKLPALDVNGVLLDTDRLYYMVYSKGEPVVFSPACYSRLTDDMMMVGYNFTDGFDFSRYGASHGVYFYDKDITDIQIQSIYFQPMEGSEDLELRSERLGMAVLDEVAGDNPTVKSVRILDINGMEVSEPAAGVFIRETLYDDGTLKASRVVLR